MTDLRTAPLPALYPLPRPADDDRFTFGLVIDMADVLKLHGFPPIRSGTDLVRLQLALFHFLYDPDSGEASR
ncbi:hypothetical protein [Micromonospora sp. CPCC 206061]|uniref:hypothetical protein n=1 Tax=Micromonospora sp. CPCC 206061 TaxID=3122410 RepID=UPI002FF36689